MSMNFIKSIAEKRPDDRAHRKFTRYSAGEFEKEEFTVKRGARAIQLSAGFEYLDVFMELMASLITETASLKGVIVSREKIGDELHALGIEPTKVTGKKYTIESNLSPATLRELVKRLTAPFLLLNVSSGSYSIKVKKSIPKPGKLQEKFVTMKLEAKDWGRVKQEFLFDVAKDCKQASIKHTYIIEEITAPKEYRSDPENARLCAQRRGRILRELTIDGEIKKSEIPLLA